MLAIRLLNHEGMPGEEAEFQVAHMHGHTRWAPSFATQVIQQAKHRGIVLHANGHLVLTERGRQLASETITS
jgi:hypothetical protein